MGKYSNFERNPRDYYKTPYKAVLPLIPHLPEKFRFAEPCVGNGVLVSHLTRHGGLCTWASDIEPDGDYGEKKDAFDITQDDFAALDNFAPDFIITNPPWDRALLHPMIMHFISLAPTWLLFDSNWANTLGAAPYLKYCRKIVPIGRVKWFGNMSGKEDASWFYFTNDAFPVTEFHAREKIKP